MATGRSDYPNQVNNVLGFPFIFRGALDVARHRDQRGDEAGRLAGARRAGQEDVPDSVLAAYGGESFRFGREYLIPKPFDYRVLLWVAPAVAEAAMSSGVARKPITDMDAYLRRLEALHLALARAHERRHPEGASAIPSASSSPRASTRRSCAPRRSSPRRGSAARSCSRASEMIAELRAGAPAARWTRSTSSTPRPRRARRATRGASHELRRRSGVTVEDAQQLVRVRNYFGAMMVDAGTPTA